MCLFLILLLAGPRAGIAVWWLFEPSRWNLVFHGWVWPVLGFLFAPWTTLMYVLVYRGGVNGLDYLWLGLAILADLGSLVGGGGLYGRRRNAVAV